MTKLNGLFLAIAHYDHQHIAKENSNAQSQTIN